VYKGICGGFLYTAIGTLSGLNSCCRLLIFLGYISTCYAQEQHRGIYIGAISSSIGIGSIVGSGILVSALLKERISDNHSAALVLGLTAHGNAKSSHVPSNVYVSIVTLQSAGFLIASLLKSPGNVRRTDGQPVALTIPKTWRDELLSLPKAIMTPSVLLTSIALFSCQMVFSLTGSLNAFHFNARTRALVNVSYLRLHADKY
jgi:hypothetical protein